MRIRVIDDWYYQANARRSATAFLESKNQKNAVYLLGPYQKPVHDLALGVCEIYQDVINLQKKVILIFLSPGTDFLKLM